MALGEFVLDFFFGPCLDNSAVDPRQNQPQPRPQQQQQQYQSQRQLAIQQPQRHHNGSSTHRNRSGRESKRLTYPSTIPENEERRKFSDDGSGQNNSRRNNSSGL
eukprot:CAMPEP_0172318528 /NCGR_PEP_ID=MMETSP1058-20130122/35144_1 /TAXON_ID=83371 /ORGANISM="Detonula confervacea, Strain CCMP 353" /LENGTH=104 /DNA_ID=CAMNT_0013033379 /DNA_START=10 /DNA_END=320 /DNA_ORIENTATION=+